MNIRSTIEQKLNAALEPAYLEVVDESSNHSRGQETHFKVTVAAQAFTGQRLIARHRQVNAALAAELAGPVHALAIHTYTPDEWRARMATAPDSPECAHGA